MKRDELKDRWFWAYPTESVDCDGITGSAHEVYSKSEVDDAVAELKDAWRSEHEACESLKASHYAEMVDAGMLERRLNRALWLARAERADDRARIFYFSDLESVLDIDGFSYDSKKKKGCKKLTSRLWRIIWLNVERKCRDKAELYK